MAWRSGVEDERRVVFHGPLFDVRKVVEYLMLHSRVVNDSKGLARVSTRCRRRYVRLNFFIKLVGTHFQFLISEMKTGMSKDVVKDASEIRVKFQISQ